MTSITKNQHIINGDNSRVNVKHINNMLGSWILANKIMRHKNLKDSHSSNGHPTLVTKSLLWEELGHIASSGVFPWMVIGDFNTYLAPFEKVMGNAPNRAFMAQFSRCLLTCGL
ncbi:hypothetical protein VNO78_14960 [Psophocarpus tetragonolobus]|uniref:Uncharacterized protein n=1 Tax=Psophocarpus tetragonolobus TaxID=3891 RepID=A0AAN9SE21_PSOTE